jgi:hypothetical protein
MSPQQGERENVSQYTNSLIKINLERISLLVVAYTKSNIMSQIIAPMSLKTPSSKTGVNFTKNASISNENRLLMTCDYLQFMCRGVLDFLPESDDRENASVTIGDWTFKPLGRANKLFDRMTRVDYNGEYFLTLLDTPRPAYMKEDFVKIDVQNHFLYYRNYVSLLLQFLRDTGLIFNNLTRMDIALDGVYTKGQVFSPKTGKSSSWHHGGALHFLESKYQSKRTDWVINGRGDYTFRGKKSDKSIGTAYIGSRSSDAYIRIYNKREELKRSNKSYINDYYCENGFSADDNLERIEFVFKGKHVAKFKQEFTLESLLDEAYLSALCREHFERVSTISRLKEDKNVSRRKRYSLIDWSTVVCGTLVRDIPPKPSKVQQAKQTIKDTHRRISSGFVDYYLGVALIHSFLKEFPCLVEWYEVKKPYFDIIEPPIDDDDDYSSFLVEEYSQEYHVNHLDALFA